LLGIPAEPTDLAARMIAADLGVPRADTKDRVIGLAQGYVSYVDAPDRVRSRSGEGFRSWYGPGLLSTMSRGLQAALAAEEGPSPQENAALLKIGDVPPEGTPPPETGRRP
jgi:hypothetical protein